MEDCTVRPYILSDQQQVGELFYDTVRSVNKENYTEQQVCAWAPESSRTGQFSRPLERNYAYVAELNTQIVGFADITAEGYLDRLFVHKDFQRKGIANKLLAVLERKARDLLASEIHTEASITAKPFFLAQGYLVEEEQVKVINNVPLLNFKMSKKLFYNK